MIKVLPISVLGALLSLTPFLQAENIRYSPASPEKAFLSDHRWEIYGGVDYKPYSPGWGSGRTSPFWGLNGEAARFFTRHWAVAGTGRGYFGTAHVAEPNEYGISRPTTDEYMYMGGPEYRYERNEHINLSLHAFFGAEYNQVNGNVKTSSGEFINPEAVGLYKDQPAFASAFGGAVDFAVNDHWAVRVEPEAILDDFRSSSGLGGLTPHLGVSAGAVYRFGAIHKLRRSSY